MGDKRWRAMGVGTDSGSAQDDFVVVLMCCRSDRSGYEVSEKIASHPSMETFAQEIVEGARSQGVELIVIERHRLGNYLIDKVHQQFPVTCGYTCTQQRLENVRQKVAAGEIVPDQSRTWDDATLERILPAVAAALSFWEDEGEAAAEKPRFDAMASARYRERAYRWQAEEIRKERDFEVVKMFPTVEPDDD